MSYEKKKKELSARSIEMAKKSGRHDRKEHERLTKKGETAMDYPTRRAYFKHLTKKGVYHHPKNPASHFNSSKGYGVETIG